MQVVERTAARFNWLCSERGAMVEISGLQTGRQAIRSRRNRGANRIRYDLRCKLNVWRVCLPRAERDE